MVLGWRRFSLVVVVLQLESHRIRLFGPVPSLWTGSASLDRIRLFGPDTAKKGGSATLCDSKYLNYSAQLTDTEVTRVRIRHVSQGKNSEDRQSHCV